MKITKGTIARTVLLAVALINMLLTNSGHSILPFSDAEINQFISDGFAIVVAIIAWWKNNSFTHEAIKADKNRKSKY